MSSDWYDRFDRFGTIFKKVRSIEIRNLNEIIGRYFYGVESSLPAGDANLLNRTSLSAVNRGFYRVKIMSKCYMLRRETTAFLKGAFYQ